MANTDIRQWAAENGVEVNAKGPVNRAAREAYQEAHGIEPDSADSGTVVPAEPEYTAGEQTPDVKVTFKDKLAKRTANRKPGRTRRRKSLEDAGTLAWIGLAGLADHLGGGPVARCLAFQAPVAGAILEDSLKGSTADRMLQPVARLATGGGDLGALLAPPLLIAMIQQKPEMYPKLAPVLEGCLKRYFKIAGPKLKKLAKEEEELAQELGGVDVAAIMEAIFTGKPIDPEMMEEGE